MIRKAIFPGSFDPFTIGHENVVVRALDLFDEIVIAVGYNSNKADFFPVDTRMAWIKSVFENESRISVAKYEGLTVYFQEGPARWLIRLAKFSTTW